MIAYVPYYSKDSTIYDIFDEIKEFESIDEMKEYLLKYWNINKRITKDNISQIINNCDGLCLGKISTDIKVIKDLLTNI